MRKIIHLVWILPSLIFVSYWLSQEVEKFDMKPVATIQRFFKVQPKQEDNLPKFKYEKEVHVPSPTPRPQSTSLGDFKSVFIRDLKTYNINTTKKAPGNRTRKIISCVGCESWFNLSPFTYHRDFKECPYSECSYDKFGENLGKASAVIFYFKKYTDNKPNRPPGQIWINSVFEPQPYNPARENEHYHLWKDVFNWTAGFAVDDDFFFPYGFLGWRDKKQLLSDDEYVNYAKQKSKTAVMWSSHCTTQGNRMAYVDEMQKYVDVDIYGKCGKLRCKGWDSCAPMLNHTYKFYLAFENSFCKDYITEKFFRSFQGRRFVVPVARGGAEYNKYFPPGTFINANDFKNAKELALYLKALANDIPRYANFLKEKDKLTVLRHRMDWCDICEHVHTYDKQKIIPDINGVTFNESGCWNPNDVI